MYLMNRLNWFSFILIFSLSVFLTANAQDKNRLKLNRSCYFQLDQDIYPGNLILIIEDSLDKFKINSYNRQWVEIELKDPYFWVETTCLNDSSTLLNCSLYNDESLNKPAGLTALKRTFNVVSKNQSSTQIEILNKNGYLNSSCLAIDKLNPRLGNNIQFSSLSLGLGLTQMSFNQNSNSDFSLNKTSQIGFDIGSQFMIGQNSLNINYGEFVLDYQPNSSPFIKKTVSSSLKIDNLYNDLNAILGLLYDTNLIFEGQTNSYEQSKLFTHEIFIGLDYEIKTSLTNINIGLNYYNPWSSNSTFFIKRSSIYSVNAKLTRQLQKNLNLALENKYLTKELNFSHTKLNQDSLDVTYKSSEFKTMLSLIYKP